MRNPDGYQLGEISARYESSGAGTISSGEGDKGGASYGIYQLSSAEGTLAKYLAWSSYKVEFEGLAPVTEAFDKKWREIAATDLGFASDQQEFIRSTHYDLQWSASNVQVSTFPIVVRPCRKRCSVQAFSSVI